MSAPSIRTGDLAAQAVPARSRRWAIVILLFIAVVINYIDRGNLSVAAVPAMRELGIAPSAMGTLLSAFFWTYALFQVPGGYLTDRYGLRWTYAAGFLLWSLGAAAIGLTRSFSEILALRLVLGVGEAIAIPAGMAYIRRNFLPQESGLPIGIFASGAMFGPAVGALMSGFLLDRIGWRLIFILTGLGGCFWLIPWLLLAPVREPGSAQSDLPRDHGRRFPWKAVVRNRLPWGITIGVFFYQYSFYFCLTWLPSYLVMGHGLSFLRMGTFTGVPLLMMAAVSILGGRLSDHCTIRFGRPLMVRRSFVAGGMLIASSLLVLLFVDSPAALFTTLIVSFIGIGFAGTNYWALTQLVSPPEIMGRVVGYQNTVGNIAGICAPLLTGLLVARAGTFRAAIAVASGSFVLGAITYLVLIREADHRELQKRLGYYISASNLTS
jgi:ACS family D-galactonate transporter-like MFS transporter